MRGGTTPEQREAHLIEVIWSRPGRIGGVSRFEAEAEMNVLTHAKQRAELSRRRLYRIDDDTTGLWAKKRAYQARCREKVRSGERSPESMFFIHPESLRPRSI
jgi:hypothetical protein